MKRLTLAISFLLAFLNTTLADEDSFHFGLKAAPSLAWLRTDTKGIESEGSKFGFSYGLITDFNFATRYAFSTGIDVTYRGGKFKSLENLKTVGLNEDSIVSTSASYTLQYIEIPITLKLKTNEIGYLTYYMQAGFAPGVTIRARQSYSRVTQTRVSGVLHETQTGEEDVDIQEDINNVNLSMIIGAGVEYKISGSTVFLGGIQFNNGFLDVFDGPAKVNSNYLALNLGVLF